MTTSEGLRALSDSECVELLRRHRFGRLALGLEGWPAILPVNYVFDGASVIIRTAPGSKLDEAPLRVVAFEIDDADRYAHWGWSVLVQGPAFDISFVGRAFRAPPGSAGEAMGARGPRPLVEDQCCAGERPSLWLSGGAIDSFSSRG